MSLDLDITQVSITSKPRKLKRLNWILEIEEVDDYELGCEEAHKIMLEELNKYYEI